MNNINIVRRFFGQNIVCQFWDCIKVGTINEPWSCWIQTYNYNYDEVPDLFRTLKKWERRIFKNEKLDLRSWEVKLSGFINSMLNADADRHPLHFLMWLGSGSIPNRKANTWDALRICRPFSYYYAYQHQPEIRPTFSPKLAAKVLPAFP